MARFQFVGEKRANQLQPGWSRRVDVEGVVYWVQVRGIRKVRIPYKPRGPEGWGWIWEGSVRQENGREVWSDRVVGSIGARGLLLAAGVIST